MVNYILAFILVHYIIRFIFGKQGNILACGLFGFAGKNPEDFNIDKFNILGLFNQSRGEHSCGVAIDGELYKGTSTDRTNKYEDFIQDTKAFPVPQKFPVVIGHTRYATNRPPYTAEHAHPFKFPFKKGKWAIAAHNGKLTNHLELAEKYGINPEGKIDSQILLNILAIGNGNEKVLIEYMGHAAIMLTSSTKPNEIWLFKGESPSTKYTKVTNEERPLFFYQETPTSMYISSLEQPLHAICETPEDHTRIKSFQTNILYRIEDGEIKDRFKFDRTNMDSRIPIKTKVHTHHTSTFMGGHCGVSNNRNNSNTNRTCSSEPSQVPQNVSVIDNPENAYKKNNLHYERVLFNEEEQPIYYEKGRWWNEGNLVTGICIFIKELGYIKVCEVEADVYPLLKDFKWEDASAQKTISFGDVRKLKFYYMYEGVLLKGRSEYYECRNYLSKKGKKEVPFLELTEMTQYPILDISRTKKEKVYPTAQNIMIDKKAANDTYCVVGSVVKYVYEGGQLKMSVLGNELYLPKDKKSYISIYDDGDWDDMQVNENTDIEDEEVDDPDVFEENLNQQLSGIKDKDLRNLLDYKDNIEEQLQYGTLLIAEFKEQEGIVKMLAEFIEDTKLKFKKISDILSELEIAGA